MELLAELRVANRGSPTSALIDYQIQQEVIMTTETVVPEVRHAWAIYLRAGEEARRRGDHRTGTDDLLLALLEDPSIEVVLGVSLQQARQALESLDQQALRALSLGFAPDAPALSMRAVPKKPTVTDVMQRNRRRLQITAQQVLSQILTLQPPDPSAVLLGALGVNTLEVRRRLDRPRPTPERACLPH